MGVVSKTKNNLLGLITKRCRVHSCLTALFGKKIISDDLKSVVLFNLFKSIFSFQNITDARAISCIDPFNLIHMVVY